MILLNFEKAIIPKEKLVDYLLSETHAIGQFKVKFFLSLGYSTGIWERLEQDIRSILGNNAVEKEQSEYGQKYEVSGELT